MSKLLKIVIALAVLGIAAMAAIYFFVFASDSPDEFEPTVIEEPGPVTDDVVGEWTVSQPSEAGYRVREKLANLPAQSDAVGRTSDVTGGITLTKTQLTKADFEVDLTTLQSDEDRRDRRVQDALQTAQFPTATFALSTPVDIDSSKATATVSVAGELTIHGVTKPVTIPITATVIDDQLELVGSITFPMADFGITPPSVAGFVSVEDDATLEFKVLLDRRSA